MVKVGPCRGSASGGLTARTDLFYNHLTTPKTPDIMISKLVRYLTIRKLTMKHTLTFHTIKLGKQVQKALKSQHLPLSLGVTPASALLLISRHATISQKQIANHLRLEPASIVTMIDELEKLKLVKRVPSENDRRQYQITLTDAGLNAANVISNQTDKLDRFLKSKLSIQEFNLVSEAFGKLADLLDEWGLETDQRQTRIVKLTLNKTEGGEHGSSYSKQQVAAAKGHTKV